MHGLAAAAGGAVGAYLRWALGGWLQRAAWASPANQYFPVGTLAVNLSGCFAIGLLAALVHERLLLAPPARTFLLVGVLGGYTTFSTFALETLTLIEEGSFALATLNALGSVVFGLLGVAAGALLARGLA